jgi:hypothetical protein
MVSGMALAAEEEAKLGMLATPQAAIVIPLTGIAGAGAAQAVISASELAEFAKKKLNEKKYTAPNPFKYSD